MKYLLTLIIVYFSIVFNTFALKPAGTILSPQNGQLNVSIQPTFEIADSNWATQIEYLISTDSNFIDTTLYKSVIYDTTYSLNAMALALSFNKKHFVKMRLSDSSEVSEWSDILSFITVSKPTILHPLDSSNQTIFTTYRWASNHYDMELQIGLANSNFTQDTISMIFEGDYNIYNYNEYFKFNDLKLDNNKNYEVRVRQNDTLYGISNWSDVIYFTTDQFPQLPTPEPNPITTSYIDYLEENELTVMDENRDVTTNNPTLGSIPGSLTVNPNGSAGYSIGIWSPPGTNGVQPSISLNYNSQSGAGIAGWGWNLTGLSSISRTPKSKYIDGEVTELSLDDTDILSLDGNRLIVTEEGTSQIYGQIGTIYTTRSGDNIRVEHVIGNTGASGAYFKVTDKQGTISYYGQNPESRSKLSPTNHLHIDHVISWRLNRVQDINGNFIDYIYDDSFEGTNLLKEIKYTGNIDKNNNIILNPYASILIEYAQKSDGNQYLSEVNDQNESYYNGLFQKDIFVIKDVIIKYETQEVKRYSFDYIFDDVTYLHRIKEYGIDDPNFIPREYLNETAFDYHIEETKVASKFFDDLPIQIDDDEYSIHFGDFNGDGIQDRLIIDRDETTTSGSNRAVGYLQHGKYFECEEEGQGSDEYSCTGDIKYTSAPSQYQDRPEGFCFDVMDYVYHGGLLYNQNIIIADINNDGKDDLILPFLSNWEEGLSERGYGPFQSFKYLNFDIYKGTENQIDWITNYLKVEPNRGGVSHPLFNAAKVNEHFLPADYTGDGYLELVYQVEYHNNSNHNDQHLYLLDLVDDNGNFINEGYETNNSFAYKKPLRSYNINWPIKNLGSKSEIHADFYTVEMISNGKAELLFSQKGVNNEEGVYTIEFDQGTPYLNKIYTTSSTNLDTETKNVLFTGDFNGDGYTDILFRNDEEDDDDSKWYVKYWMGKYFSENFKVEGLEGYKWYNSLHKTMMLGDFNGDGKIDIYKGADITTQNSGPYFESFISKRDLKGSIIYSFGNGKFNEEQIFNYGFEKELDNNDNVIFVSEWGINPGEEFISRANNISRLAYSPNLFGKKRYFSENLGEYKLKDLNGDGNSDIFVPQKKPGDIIGVHDDAVILINPSQHPRHLKTISDGYGNRTELHYEPISKGTYDDVNEDIFRKERTPTPIDKMKALNAGVWVVNKVDKIKSKETLPIQTVEYSYGKSIVNKELGFLGFKEFFSKSFDEISSTNHTENRQYFTTISDETKKIFSVIPEKNVTLRNGNPISESIFNKQIHSFSNGNFQIYDVNTISKDYLTESMITNNYTYDPIDNNILTEESIISSLDGLKVVRKDTKEITYGSHGLNRGGIAIDNKIETVTTSSEYFNYDAVTGGLIPLTTNNPIQSTTTKYEYKGISDNFLLDKEISYFGEPKAVESIFEYNLYGNRTSTTLHPTFEGINNTLDRSEFYVMDNKGRFATSHSNGLVSSYRVYDEIFGNVIHAVDLNGNYIDYEFDSFGRLTLEKDMYQNVVQTKRDWYTGNPILPNNQNILYVTRKESAITADKIDYFDSYGNLLREELESFKDKNTINFIVNTYEYFPDNTLRFTFKPYFLSDGPSGKVVEIQYDSYLRQNLLIDQGRQSSTEYNYDGTPRLTRLLAPDGKSKEILTNEAGTTVLTRDNENFEVKFQYKNDMKSAIITTIALDDKTTQVETEFDIYGNKIRVEDDDGGEYTYTYNYFGELIEQEGPNGIETYRYDNLGRVIEKVNSEGIVLVTYIGNGNGKGKIFTIAGPTPGDLKTYTYDPKGRVLSKTILIQGQIFNYTYSYNEGFLEKKTLPSGVQIKYTYNSISDLIEIYRVDNFLNNKLWSIEELNSFGVMTKYTQGDNAIFNETLFDQFQLTDGVKASSSGWNGPWNLQEWDYEYNQQNGNMLKRSEKITGQIEHFTYDNLDRIETIKDKDLNTLLSMDYQNDGSIKNKSDVGNYSYISNINSTEPEFPYHAVKKIQNSPKELQGHTIVSNSFNSVKTIDSDCSYYAELFYNSSESRNRMKVYFKGIDPAPGTLEYTKYYLDDFEMKTYPNGDRKEVSYINSPVGVIASIIKHTDGSNNMSTEKLYFLQSDVLGSVERLIDDTGNPISNAWFSYNIWGELRDPYKWETKIDKVTLENFEFIERGFTGHEHINEFTLINMNGRVYDPIIGQFIQPDNYIASPNESQSYNRFSYVLNNPLKYTDPSGEWIQFAFMAVISAAQATTAYNWGGTSAMWNSIGMSVGSFALGVATGALADGVFKGLGMTTTGGELLTNTGSILAGATSSVTSSAVLSGVTGSKFTLTSLFSAAAIGGLQGGAKQPYSQKELDNFTLAAKLNDDFHQNLLATNEPESGPLINLGPSNSQSVPTFGKFLNKDIINATPIVGYTGDNIFFKMYYHYQVGGMKSYDVNTRSLDFTGITSADLVSVDGEEDLFTLQTFNSNILNVDFNKRMQTGLALGSITLERKEGNTYTILDDVYNFDMHTDDIFKSRNIYTAIAFWGHIGLPPLTNNWILPLITGGEFTIIFHGTVTIE